MPIYKHTNLNIFIHYHLMYLINSGETYITLEAYEADLPDEISFPKDVIVEAIHKLLDGWWIIRYVR